MKIPFTDLKREYTKYSNDYNNAFKNVFNKASFVLGEEVTKFEIEFSKFIGSKYTVGVNSGLDALILTIKALGLSYGDEILLPSNTFIATVIAISQNGCKPVLVPTNKYYNIDTDLIDKYITKKTKALIVVHLYGQSAKMNKIMNLTKKHNLFLIEDCAQSHGAAFDNRMTGNWGIAGCFSFYPTKTLGGFGDGGAITTDSKDLYNTLLKLRNYGSLVKYQHDVVGFNSRLDEIQAGMLRVKLSHLSLIIKNRRIIAEKYLNGIHNPKILLPLVEENSTHVWHLFVVQVENREEFMTYLKDAGIETGIHYPIPIHLTGAYRDKIEYNDGGKLKKVSDRIVSLPIFDWMTHKEVNYVIKAVNSFSIEE